jgi:gamma-glutamyltranspeptidase
MAEGQCDAEVVRELQRKGHEILVLGPKAFSSTVNLVMAAPSAMCAKNEPQWLAASDPRKNGEAAGY